MNWPTRTGKFLTLLGIVPFIIASFFAYKQAGEQLWPILVVLVSTYTALIVTFIAGSQWGVTRFHADKPCTFVLILTNVSTLLAWVGILFPSWVISWLILVVCLWLVLAVDYRLFKKGIWPKAYMTLRFLTTLIVNVCFVVMFYFGLQYF